MVKGFRRWVFRFALAGTVSLALAGAGMATETTGPGSYKDLLTLFEEWREFEAPPLRDGAPDYTQETFAARYAEF